MPASHLSLTPAINRPSRPSERGFGLVEIVAVLLIAMVLMAIAIGSFRGTKRTTQYKVAQGAAATYAQAIEAYMADNGQVPPALGSTGWPTGTRAQRIGGPVDAMLKNKRYMARAAPEAVSDGVVDFIAPSGAPVGGAQATITYSVVAGNAYQLLVRSIPQGGEAELSCVVTNAPTPPAGLGRCS